MAGLTVTMTADEADLFAKLTALTNKTGESGRAFEKASEQSKAAAQAAREASQEQAKSARAGKALADQLIRAHESLEDQYKRERKTLDAGMKAGKVSAEDYAKSVGLLDKKFEDLAKNDQALGRMGNKMTSQSKITTDIATKVGGMVTIWGSIEKAIGFASEALDAHNERMRESLQLTKEMNPGNLDLGSVSDSPQELKTRMDQVRKMRTEYGLSMEESQGTIFALDSAGLLSADPAKAKEDQRTVDFFSKVGQVTDAKKFVQVAGQLKASFGLQADESVNATMTTAKLSMMETPEFARLLSEASQGTSQMQSQDRKLLAAETAATVAALSDTLQGSTGTIVSGAASKFAQVPELQGLSFRDATKAALAMSAEERTKVFGQNESVQKYLNDSSKQATEIDDFVNQAKQSIDLSGTKNSALNRQLATQRIANPNFDKINTINAIKAQREYTEMDSLAGRAGDLEIQDEMVRAAYADQFENVDQSSIAGKLKTLFLTGSQQMYNVRRMVNLTNTGTIDQAVLDNYHAKQLAEAPNFAGQMQVQQRFDALPSERDQGNYIDLRPLTQMFKAQTDAIEKAANPKPSMVTRPGDDR